MIHESLVLALLLHLCAGTSSQLPIVHSDVQIKCRDYCLMALSDCPEYLDFSSFPECSAMCLATKFNSSTQTSINMFGDSLECRMHRFHLAYTTGLAGWHCPHGRLDGNMASDGSCPDGCPCVEGCSFQGEGLEREEDCAIGSQDVRPECAHFMFAVVQGAMFDVDGKDPWTLFAKSVLDVQAYSVNANTTRCSQLKEWIEMGCVCDAAAAGWMERLLGQNGSRVVEELATRMLPSICNGVTADPWMQCPEHRRNAPEVDVGECLSAVSAASVCSIESKVSSCCAALALLDSMGCLCDSVFSVLSALDPDLEDLRSSLYESCLPPEAQYANTVTCPNPTYTAQGCSAEPWVRTLDSAMLRERVRAIKRFGDLFDKHSKRFQYDVSVQDFAQVLDEEPAVYVEGLGDYVGLEPFMEYLSMGFTDGTTNGMWGQEVIMLHDWKVQGDTIGYRMKADNRWYRRFTRTNSYSIDYIFKPCSAAIAEVRIQPEVEVVELITGALSHREFGPEAYCEVVMEYCVGDLQEFESVQRCVEFQRSLPRNSCASLARGLEGNSSSCKMKHAFMIPIRPQHHCHHAGTGWVADDKGEYICVQADCDKPLHPVRVAPRTDAVPALDAAARAWVCRLDVENPLFIHLSILQDSACLPPRQVLEDMAERPPTRASAASLQGLCRPPWAAPSASAAADAQPDPLRCERLRYSLVFALERFRHHCSEEGGAGSDLPSPKAVLREAAEAAAMHQLVCTAHSRLAEHSLCRACSAASTPQVASWAGGGDAFRGGGQTGGAGAPSALCRRTLHWACANLHGLVPAFCAACFPALRGDNASAAAPLPAEAQEAACAEALAAFWEGAGCAASRPSLAWFEVDAAAYAAPYPGEKPEESTTEHDVGSEKVFDFVVVGAGTAGCVVARRLSDAGFSVLVLEEGVDWNKDEDLWELSRARRSIYEVWETPLAKRTVSKGNKALLGRPVEITAGSTLGGTSSINGGLYSRPAEEEFDEFWPEGWKGEEVRPFFLRQESYEAPTDRPDMHGEDGPLTVQAGTPQTLAKAWVEAARKAGLEELQDGASGVNGKSGVYHLRTTFKEGRRQDAFSAYLKPILPRKGLEIRTGARVAKVVLEDDGGAKRATGVVYMLQGQARVSVYAKREVILSGGWMGSPKVLLLSGVGPRDHLEEMEIDVEVEVPGVGQQLRGRPMQGMAFGGQSIPPEGMPSLVTSPETEAEWAVNGSGVLDTPIFAVYGKDSSEVPRPSPQARRAAAAPRNDFLYGFGDRSAPGLPLQAMMSICKLCRPASLGSLQLRSPNPEDAPIVDLDMFAAEHDLEVMVTCVRRTLEIYRHFRFRGMDLSGLDKMNDEQLRNHIRATAEFSQHAASSCRMGDGPLDVVDTRLRVRGVGNLRVIDGSIMPELPCSGPLATTYMIGERGAAWMLEEMAPEWVVGSHVIDLQLPARAVALALLGSLLLLLLLLLAMSLRRCWVTRKTFLDRPVAQTAALSMSKRTAGTEHEQAHTADDSATARGGEEPANGAPQEVLQKGSEDAPANEVRVDSSDGAEEARETQQAGPSLSKAPSLARTSSFAKRWLRRKSVTSSAASVTQHFNRSLRRKSLLSAMRQRNLATTPHLSIYFHRLQCRAEKVRYAGLLRRPGPQILSCCSGKVEQGKLTVLMGSSGAGKSTLLHQLAQRPMPVQCSGELLYEVSGSGGELLAVSGSQSGARMFFRRNIALLSQHTDDLPAGLTVFEIMVYYFSLMVSPQLETETAGIRVIHDTLEFVGLAEQAHKFVHEISGGQKRRLQIGIRLLDTPLALFLDEPDAGLDSTTILKIMVLLTQITDKYGVTIVCSLHRPRVEALQLAHSIYLLHAGVGIFQGSYSDLHLAVSRLQRPDFAPESCAVEYVLDYESFDSDLLRCVFADHVARCNAQTLPAMKALVAARDPNEEAVLQGLLQGSVLLCSTTLLSVFVNLVGCRRGFRYTALDMAAKHACALTFVAMALLFICFVDGFLPVESTEDVAVLHGVLLIWGSSTLALFQVVVGGEMVEPELRVLERLMQDHLLTPLHVAAFWVARSVLVCLCCLPGFLIFYGGLGWQAEHGVDSGLLWLLFVLQACLCAHLVQTAFGGALGPVVYGLWSAVQILFCGLSVPLTRVPAAWRWISLVNPQHHAFSVQIVLEIAVGRHVECGESCAALLEAMGYARADLLVSVLVLAFFLLLQIVLLYFALRRRATQGEFSGIVAQVERGAFAAAPLEPSDLSETGHGVLFGGVNVRKLLRARAQQQQQQRGSDSAPESPEAAAAGVSFSRPLLPPPEPPLLEVEVDHVSFQLCHPIANSVSQPAAPTGRWPAAGPDDGSWT